MKIENDYKGKANFISLSFPTSQIGYIAGNELSGFGIILKTTDAGNSWNRTSYSLPYFIDYKIIFPSTTVGYITTHFPYNSSGSVYMLMKSKDGGNVWETLDSTQDVSIEQMVWKSEDLGLFISYHLGDPPESYLRYTSNGGKTILSAGNTGVVDKTAVGSGEGSVWYCGISYKLSRSEDTNFHWMSTNEIPNKTLEYGTFFIANGPSSYCVIHGYPAVFIFKTTDNGLNWFEQFKDTSLSPIAGYAPTSQTGFLLASYDSLTTKKWKILKTIDGGGPALDQVHEYSENNFFLSPNPTTGIITVQNTEQNISHITVSNILGEQMLELVKPNAPEFTLDLSKLPPGIYFARFVMAGEVVTRKIVKEH